MLMALDSLIAGECHITIYVHMSHHTGALLRKSFIQRILLVNVMTFPIESHTIRIIIGPFLARK